MCQGGCPLTRRQRFYSIVIGACGAIGSLLALGVFIVRMRSNGLTLPGPPTKQAFYQSVGTAYSGGFTAGFSLCFFLMLLAVAIGTWFDGRKVARQADPIAPEVVGPA